MSAWSDWYKKPLSGFDDTDHYYGKDDLQQAFYAGLESAAVEAWRVHCDAGLRYIASAAQASNAIRALKED